MPLDLGGIGAFGSAVNPAYLDAQQKRQALALEALRQRQAQEEFAAAQRQRAGQAAAAQLLSQPQMIPGAQPMPVPQGAGQPSVPASPTPQGGPAASPGPAVASPGAAAPAPSAPAMPGGYDVRSLAEQIKKQNPGIDDGTLYQAIVASQQLLSPEGKAQMQMLQQEFKLQILEETLRNRGALQDQKIQAQMDMLKEREDNQRWITAFVQNALGNRQQTSEEGKDRRQGVSEQGKADRQSAAEAGKNARAAGKNDPDQQAFNAATKAANALDSDISKITGQYAGGKPPADSDDGKELARLTAQRNKYRQDADAAYKRWRDKSGGQVPPYKAAVTAAGKAAGTPAAGATGTQGNPAAPTTQAEFDALPSGAVYVNPSDGKTYRKN